MITFESSTGPETAILKEVRWGLVWRDFILEDGRVIPEHRILGCPQPQVWRKINEVTDSEREECEERLLSMAGAGMDPRQRDQPFWAELNQYLAYTYLRYKQAECNNQDKIGERLLRNHGTGNKRSRSVLQEERYYVERKTKQVLEQEDPLRQGDSCCRFA